LLNADLFGQHFSAAQSLDASDFTLFCSETETMLCVYVFI